MLLLVYICILIQSVVAVHLIKPRVALISQALKYQKKKKVNLDDDIILNNKKHFVNAISGAISCSFTHVLVTPLDVIKTHVQVQQLTSSSSSSPHSVRQSIKKLMKNDGLSRWVILTVNYNTYNQAHTYTHNLYS